MSDEILNMADRAKQAYQLLAEVNRDITRDITNLAAEFPKPISSPLLMLVPDDGWFLLRRCNLSLSCDRTHGSQLVQGHVAIHPLECHRGCFGVRSSLRLNHSRNSNFCKDFLELLGKGRGRELEEV